MPEKRPLRAEDLFRIPVVSDPQISPDGARVAFIVRVTDEKKNKYWSRLWMVSAQGGDARRFTFGEVDDSAPRWSPDGTRIAFVRTKDRQTQIWVIPADGGEARPLTRLDEGDVGEPRWSPDGNRIAFTFRPTHPDFTRKAQKEREESGKSTPPRRITRLHYREDGYGWKDCPQHVFVCDASTGEAAQVTGGDGDDFDPAWSPDGKWIVFASNRSDDPDGKPHEVDLWVVSSRPSRNPASRFTRLPAPVGHKAACAWSPDGRWIAYTGVETADDPFAPRHDRVWVVSPPSGRGQARCLTAGLDRGVGVLALSDVHAGYGAGQARWTGDSTRLLFLAGDRGNAVLYGVGLDGGDPVPLTRGAQAVTGFSVANDRVAAVITAPTKPGDVYLLTPSRLTPHRLTDLHARFRAEVALSAPEEIWLKSPDGAKVQAWVLRPTGLQKGRKYPCLLYIHGGPHLQYGNAFFHELQWHAARGYGVVYCNPHGSANLTEAFMTSIRGAWGGRDYEDLLTAADFAERLPGVDPKRMGVCGGSYGGYATNWLIGHTSRFRCAITDRSVVNMVSMWGQCDYPSRPDGYWKGNTWNAAGALVDQSPLTHAANCETPLLIIHSEGDWRCPIGQAQELFAALKHLKKCPVELVWYPPETSHGMSRGGPPDLRLDRLKRYGEWLDRYLQTEHDLKRMFKSEQGA